jgi:DNA-directed RNA polymerase subunit RPC12/RpoP
MSLTKDELTQLIEKTVKQSLTEQEKAKDKTVSPETSIDHLCHCPDCFCGLMDKMNNTSDYACSDCGLPLGNKAFVDKIEKCPNCGSKATPKQVER